MRRALLAALLLAAAGEAAAQDPRAPARPGRDTIPADTSAARPAVQDTLYDRLLRLEGYVPVEYQGDSARFDNRERTLRLRGRPVVERDGQRLQSTDSIVYRERTNLVEAYGSPQATGEGQDIVGDVMYYDLGTRRAIVRGARTTITEGATWFVRGDVTSEEQGARIYGSGSTFTSDDREDPAYYFRVEQMKVLRDRVLVGRPAYLYFRGVPVFVLPFIVQDLERGRRSGFLIPEFEINDIIRTDAPRGTRGTGRQIRNIGYYWAINEYMGAQAALDWRSQSWLALDVGYQFNVRRRFLNGNASLQYFWAEEGTRYNIAGSGGWQPDERTQLGTSLNYMSSTTFERDRVVDPFRQTQEASSTLSFSRRMDWATLSGGGELRQSIATGDNNLGTRLSIGPQPITLFPAGMGAPRWYNDATVTLNGNGLYNRRDPGEARLRREQPTQTAGADLTGSVRFGPVSLAGGTSYNAQSTGGLTAIDSAAAAPGAPVDRLGELPEVGTRTLRWNAGTSYEFRLMGATRLSPSINVAQDVVRRDTTFATPPPDSLDLRRWGTFVAAPMRMNLGTSLRTELFGFFPGVGPYSAIRHRISPSVTHTYAPQVRQDTLQLLVHGIQGGREVNQVSIGFDQTFEAKLRAPRPQTPAERGAAGAGRGNPADATAGGPGAQSDTATANLAPDDPRGAREARAVGDTLEGDRAGAAPAQDRKVTLLAISTSALAYSFVPIEPFDRRFQTGEISNTIRSDLMGGFTVNVAHDLFDDEGQRGLLGPGPGDGSRRFSPFLTSVTTSLSFGAGSALFRWLGFARGDEGDRATERGHTPPDEGMPTVVPPGSPGFTNTPMGMGGFGGGTGAWNASLNYSLRRIRPSRGDIPAAIDRGNQQVSGNLTFYPSRNWALNWYTDYSITENRFGAHALNLKRDLYRWQANFDFRRAPNGNTSFSFSAHLTDLPDLKADWRRSNIGADRAQ